MSFPSNSVILVVILLGPTLVSCAQRASDLSSSSAAEKPPIVIAHRGGAMEVPENTLAACKHALKAGFDAVEIDVRVTADGEAVVIHDDTLERTGKGKDKRAIAKLSLEDVQGVDVGSFFESRFKAERVPTLDDVLALGWGKTRLMIEIKRDGKHDTPAWRAIDGRLADAVVASMKRARSRKGLAFASFSSQMLAHLHERMPEIPLIGIVSKKEFLAAHLKLPLETLAVSRKIVSSKLRSDLTRRRVALWCWTVRKPREMRPLVKIGVDGIITDIPTKVRSLLRD